MSVKKEDVLKRKRSKDDEDKNKKNKLRKKDDRQDSEKEAKKSSEKSDDKSMAVALNVKHFSKNEILNILSQHYDNAKKFREILKKLIKGPLASGRLFYTTFIGQYTFTVLEKNTLLIDAIAKQNWSVLDACLTAYVDHAKKNSTKFKKLTVSILKTHLAFLCIYNPDLTNEQFEGYIKHYKIDLDPSDASQLKIYRSFHRQKSQYSNFGKLGNPCELLFSIIKIKSGHGMITHKLKSSQIEGRLKIILENNGKFDKEFFKEFLKNEIEHTYRFTTERYLNLLKIFLKHTDYLGSMEGLLEFAYDSGCSKDTILCLKEHDPSFESKTSNERKLLFFARYGFIKQWQELWQQHTQSLVQPLSSSVPALDITSLRKQQLKAIIETPYFDRASIELVKILLNQAPTSSPNTNNAVQFATQWNNTQIEFLAFNEYVFQRKYPCKAIERDEHYYKLLHQKEHSDKELLLELIKTWALKVDFFEKSTHYSTIARFFSILLESVKRKTLEIFLKSNLEFDLIKEMGQKEFLVLRLVTAYAEGIELNLSSPEENNHLSHLKKNFLTIVNHYLSKDDNAQHKISILLRAFIHTALFPEKAFHVSRFKVFFEIFKDESFKKHLTPQLLNDSLHTLFLDFPQKFSEKTIEIIDILESFGADLNSLNKNKLNLIQQHILTSKAHANSPQYERWESEDLALTKYFLARKINHHAKMLQGSLEQSIFDIIVEAHADSPRAFQTHMAYLCGNDDYRPFIHAANERLQLRRQKEGKLKIKSLHEMAQNVHADALHQSASECGKAIFDKYIGTEQNITLRNKKIHETINFLQNLIFERLKVKVKQTVCKIYSISDEEWNNDIAWTALFDFNLKNPSMYSRIQPWSAGIWGLEIFQAYRWITITRINYQRVPKDKVSQLSIDEILAAVILASQDREVFKEADEVNNSINILITHLSELQIEYVKKGSDLYKAEDQPSCPGGSFPKIVSSLDKRHPMVKLYTIGGSNLITFITNFFDAKFNALDIASKDQLIQEIVGKDTDDRDKRWHLSKDDKTEIDGKSEKNGKDEKDAKMDVEDDLISGSRLSRFVNEVECDFYKEDYMVYAVSRNILTKDKITPWFAQPFPLNQFKDISLYYLQGLMAKFYDEKFLQQPSEVMQLVLLESQKYLSKSFIEKFKEEFLKLPLLELLTSSQASVFLKEDILRYCFKNPLPIIRCARIMQSLEAAKTAVSKNSESSLKMDTAEDATTAPKPIIFSKITSSVTKDKAQHSAPMDTEADRGLQPERL